MNTSEPSRLVDSRNTKKCLQASLSSSLSFKRPLKSNANNTSFKSGLRQLWRFRPSALELTRRCPVIGPQPGAVLPAVTSPSALIAAFPPPLLLGEIKHGRVFAPRFVAAERSNYRKHKSRGEEIAGGQEGGEGSGGHIAAPDPWCNG